MAVQVKVMYFAAARELLGLREESLSLKESGGDITTDTLREFLSEKYPSAAQYIKDITLAVNLEYVMDGDIRSLQNGDEVALIPPISGG
jgi:molybdopterin converting factor subunit 1